MKSSHVVRLAFALSQLGLWLSLVALLMVVRCRAGNFTVHGVPEPLAGQVAQLAEELRRSHAREWLGYELPAWSTPCPIQVVVSQGAGGVTSFVFDGGSVGGWRMRVQGPPERILDSVLPHEVLHTVFASHFKRALPRWADEGACSNVEHESQRRQQHARLVAYLRTQRGIPTDRLFAMTEYPADILPLYDQSHSLCMFLVEHNGRRGFVDFLEQGLASDDWPTAVAEHFAHASLRALQDAWVEWLAAGSPRSPRVIAAAYQGPAFQASGDCIDCVNPLTWQRGGWLRNPAREQPSKVAVPPRDQRQQLQQQQQPRPAAPPLDLGPKPVIDTTQFATKAELRGAEERLTAAIADVKNAVDRQQVATGEAIQQTESKAQHGQAQLGERVKADLEALARKAQEAKAQGATGVREIAVNAAISVIGERLQQIEAFSLGKAAVVALGFGGPAGALAGGLIAWLIKRRALKRLRQYQTTEPAAEVPARERPFRAPPASA